MTISVAEVIAHPAASDAGTLVNDYALFKLSSSLPYTDYIRPACLPEQGQSQPVSPPTRCFTTGYGATSEGGPSASVLQEVEVPIVLLATCQSNYPGGGIGIEHICAGRPEGGVDSCQVGVPCCA